MSALVEALATRHRLVHVDETSIDAFLNQDGTAILFFPGDPSQHGETDDLAVIFPELAQTFAMRARAAVVPFEATHKLKTRFQVSTLPAVVIIRGGVTVGQIPRVRDWSDYVTIIDALLKPSALRSVAAQEGASA